MILCGETPISPTPPAGQCIIEIEFSTPADRRFSLKLLADSLLRTFKYGSQTLLEKTAYVFFFFLDGWDAAVGVREYFLMLELSEALSSNPKHNL